MWNNALRSSHVRKEWEAILKDLSARHFFAHILHNPPGVACYSHVGPSPTWPRILNVFFAPLWNVRKNESTATSASSALTVGFQIPHILKKSALFRALLISCSSSHLKQKYNSCDEPSLQLPTQQPVTREQIEQYA